VMEGTLVWLEILSAGAEEKFRLNRLDVPSLELPELASGVCSDLIVTDDPYAAKQFERVISVVKTC